MFSISKDDELLTFTVSKEQVKFGDGTRILFWIDRNRGIMQRGRQEQIPLETISGFDIDGETPSLICRLGDSVMSLYQGNSSERDALRRAAKDLAEYCGVYDPGEQAD